MWAAKYKWQARYFRAIAGQPGRKIRARIRFLILYLIDIGYRLIGERVDTVPPLRFMFDGRPSYVGFLEDGNEFFRYFVNLCGLRSNDAVLDVGSGIGRNAVPLAQYLDLSGKYVGFDTVRLGIEWCKETISKKHPNFEFFFFDLHNGLYNPTGLIKSANFKFPIPDQTIDLVIVSSVFTHMLPDDIENYLSEIGRVLKRGGKCFSTFFIADAYALSQVERKRTTLYFCHKISDYWSIDCEHPEAAVLFAEEKVRSMYLKAELKIDEPIHLGSWSKRADGLSFQDFIVATKS